MKKVIDYLKVAITIIIVWLATGYLAYVISTTSTSTQEVISILMLIIACLLVLFVAVFVIVESVSFIKIKKGDDE